MKNISYGFTLFELIITLAIIGVVATIATPLYVGYVKEAKIAKAAADIAKISMDCTRFKNDCGIYPNSLADVRADQILDPWNKPYRYFRIEGSNQTGMMRKDRFMVPINSDFDLYSTGADGKSVTPLQAKDSKDDVIRANDGGYIGLAEGY